jgi:hypothetical protein
MAQNGYWYMPSAVGFSPICSFINDDTLKEPIKPSELEAILVAQLEGLQAFLPVPQQMIG